MAIRRRQAGFNLIEILVSAFILAVCLLANLKMQSLASKGSVESRQLHQASRLGKDMLERIQINQQWLVTTSDDGYSVSSLIGKELEEPGCITEQGLPDNCDGASIRDHDLYQLQQKLSGSVSGEVILPSADVCIDQNNDTGEIVIAVSWKGQQGRGDSAGAATGELAKSVASSCGSASVNRRMVLMSTILG